MKNNFIHLYLLFILCCFVLCWAMPTSLNNEKAKANCPNSLQNNPEVPCWSLGIYSKCYCFSTTKRLDWRAANDFCRGGGLTLLGIETYEEDMLISNHIKGISTPELLDDYYWTAGRYSQEGNKRWEWATVAPFQQMTYTNWYTGLPNNNAPGSFAYVNYLFDRGVWFDMANTTSILFVCESTGGSTTTESTTAEWTTAEWTTAYPTTTELTTAYPTTAEQTTAYPTTAERTTAYPTTAYPTTAEQTTAYPTTAEQTTAYPTTAEQTTAYPTTAEQTTAYPTTTEWTTAFRTTTTGTSTESTTTASIMNPFTLQVEVTETENSRLLNVDNSFRCPGNGNWQHPVHCHYFYTCYDHRGEPAQLWQCEENFLYDVRRRQCRYSKDTVCGNRLQPKKQ